MNFTRTSCGVCLAVVVTVASCTDSRVHQTTAERPATDTGQSGSLPTMPTGPVSAAATNPAPAAPKHGLRDAQLSDLMLRMSASSQRYWPEEVPRPGDDQRIGDSEKAARAAMLLADGLVNAAERIPETIAHIPMSDADRAGIRAEAITLRTQSLQLGRAARAKNMEEVQSGLNAISSTCLSCHSRYRDFAGELEFQRVSRDLPEPTAMIRSDGAKFQ